MLFKKIFIVNARNLIKNLRKYTTESQELFKMAAVERSFGFGLKTITFKALLTAKVSFLCQF